MQGDLIMRYILILFLLAVISSSPTVASGPKYIEETKVRSGTNRLNIPSTKIFSDYGVTVKGLVEGYVKRIAVEEDEKKSGRFDIKIYMQHGAEELVWEKQDFLPTNRVPVSLINANNGSEIEFSCAFQPKENPTAQEIKDCLNQMFFGENGDKPIKLYAPSAAAANGFSDSEKPRQEFYECAPYTTPGVYAFDYKPDTQLLTFYTLTSKISRRLDKNEVYTEMSKNGMFTVDSGFGVTLKFGPTFQLTVANNFRKFYVREKTASVPIHIKEQGELELQVMIQNGEIDILSFKKETGESQQSSSGQKVVFDIDASIQNNSFNHLSLKRLRNKELEAYNKKQKNKDKPVNFNENNNNK